MKLAAIKPVSRVLARELGITALLLFGVSVVVFAILYLAPGDPLNVLLEGQSPRSELALGMREALGIPRTWYGQYAAWFGKMVQGNFGSQRVFSTSMLSCTTWPTCACEGCNCRRTRRPRLFNCDQTKAATSTPAST